MSQPSLQKPPQRPETLHPFAAEILSALAADPASSEIVLGGYFALKHYLDYRQTHDIDAWWRSGIAEAGVQAIQKAMNQFAQTKGLSCNKKTFGDTLSFELAEGTKKVFSFQISTRSVELDRPLPSPWPPIQIETLADNLGAKMNALVNRGSPRDFTDIAKAVEAGLATVEECWTLWQRKNPSETVSSGKQRARLHLELLERRRPLESIQEPADRAAAAIIREWFKTHLTLE